ncbi:MAG: hypothetical protein ACM3SS_05545 [Rhodospirillaceae bacterium]
MANNLFISYDLMTPGQGYDKVVERIKSLGSWAKVHYSLWYVSSSSSAKDACAHVWSVMDANDKLIVIDAKNNSAAWQNLDTEVAKYIRDTWT